MDEKKSIESITKAFLEAKIVFDRKKQIKEKKKGRELSDDEKIELYTKYFPEFAQAYPTQVKFAIFANFSPIAFQRFLEYKKINERNYGRNMDEMLKADARFAQWNWEAFQTKRFEAHESTQVYETALKELMEEKKSIEKIQKEFEEKKVDRIRNSKKERLTEMLGNLANLEENGNITEEKRKEIIDEIRSFVDIHYAFNKRKQMHEELKEKFGEKTHESEAENDE
jgi:hypothetical protein